MTQALVIEDDEVTAQSIASALRAQGYQVRWESTGRAGLSIASSPGGPGCSISMAGAAVVGARLAPAQVLTQKGIRPLQRPAHAR